MEIQGPFDPNRIRLIKQRDSDSLRGREDAGAGGDGDRLEISDEAKLLGSIGQLPEVRTDKIAEIREQIKNGTFETPEKLRQAILAFLEGGI